MSHYDRLVAEALHAPIVGWNFDWLEDRATEQRPTWGYSERAKSALASSVCALDIDTGGGEALAFIGRFPPSMVATESWPPNVTAARKRLRPLGVHVVQTGDDPVLPFGSESFDLVLSRHGLRGRADSAETDTWWDEVARVLRLDGRFLSQQVGGNGMRELREAMGLSPTASRSPWDAATAQRVIGRSGLRVSEVREEFPRTVFFDVGAIVYYLRMVIWIVPGFDPASHDAHLRRLHERIQADGSFVTYAHRIFVDAQKEVYAA